MADYDFTASLSPLDFELLSKDLIEAELGIQLENFSEGRDKGIDLRYAPIKRSAAKTRPPQVVKSNTSSQINNLIVQCKRYSKFSDLKSKLKKDELKSITALNPARYILTTSVSLSPGQSDEIQSILSPYIRSTGDIYGRERLNSLLTKHEEIERRHLKLWVGSTGVIDSILNAGTHIVSREEIERTLSAAKLYVRNDSFDEALEILKEHRVCIISGLPGIGKTTLARMLLLYFYQRKFDVIKIESNISEARSVSYHSRPRFYYYDDFLGQTASAEKLGKNEDQKLLDFMTSVRESKDSVFVLTTREYILNQAKLQYEKLSREKFDHRTCIVDLAKYSRRIRAQILYNHLHFSKLPRPHIEQLVADRNYLPIIDHTNYNPRLIEYLTNVEWVGQTTPSEYVAQFLRNLDNPVAIWEHAFRHQLSSHARHLLYVLTSMPLESVISDLEQAFNQFHRNQCKVYGIAHSATDFKDGLKELEGTFLAVRKIDESLLIRFQNPSIRDFMQNLLLSGECLAESIDSIVFFEQAQWYSETLSEEAPHISVTELRRHAPSLVAAMKRVIDASSCTIAIYGPPSARRVHTQVSSAPRRLTEFVTTASNQHETSYTDWIAQRTLELARQLELGQVSPSSYVGSIGKLRDLGQLNTEQGKNLVVALKQRSMHDLKDIDEFEVLGNLIKELPETFDSQSMNLIGESFSKVVHEYAMECEMDNPEELRDEAARIGHIGDLLHAGTEEEQQILRDAADELEKEETSQWDDDDERAQTSIVGDECSDSELDSMFGTLEE